MKFLSDYFLLYLLAFSRLRFGSEGQVDGGGDEEIELNFEQNKQGA